MSIKVLSIDKIRKKYKSGNASAIILPKEKTLALPSRNLALNHLLGSGLVYGKILELIGYESTGKTLMALDFAYAAQILGGVVLWNDAEGSWANHWAQANGIDPDNVELYPDSDIEGLSDWIRDMIILKRSELKNNEPILLVVDSLAALDKLENIDSDQSTTKAEMGNRAKAIYLMYRKRNKFFIKYGVVVIVINQVREKVGASMFESAETTPGGAATKFYASYRITLVRSKAIKAKIKGKEQRVGQNVTMQTRKNKVAPPRDSVYTQVYFIKEYTGYTGYSRYHGLPDILEAEGIVKKKGSRYYYKDKMIANGEDNFLKLLVDNEDLRKKLIKRSSVNTISKTREMLESIKENLYPVKVKADENEDSNN
jgi:recombination protein RecA